MKEKKTGILRKLKERISKVGTLNIVLVLVGAFFLWFNWRMLLIFQSMGQIPETYACTVAAATIGECGICGWIRTTKDKRREREWLKEDELAQIAAPISLMDKSSTEDEETLPGAVNGSYEDENKEEEING